GVSERQSRFSPCDQANYLAAMRVHRLLTQRSNACIPSPIPIPPGVGGGPAELLAVSHGTPQCDRDRSA
ncbi:MAG: hypothetical protein ACK5AM_07380, partial [Pirellulaceae bacterium]